METKQIIVIGLVSALIGGLIGGGLSYIIINPQIVEVQDSLVGIENAIGVQTNQLTEQTTQLSEQTEIIQSSLMQEMGLLSDDVSALENMNASLFSEIEIIRAGVFGIALDQMSLETELRILQAEPRFHLAFQDRNPNTNQFTLTSDEFDTEGYLFKIDYDIFVENNGADEYYYNWLQINVYNDDDGLMGSLFLEGNDHVRDRENFCDTFSLNLLPDTYYIKLEVNTENAIRSSSISVWDYY